jgi:hypothetical protein
MNRHFFPLLITVLFLTVCLESPIETSETFPPETPGIHFPKTPRPTLSSPTISVGQDTEPHQTESLPGPESEEFEPIKEEPVDAHKARGCEGGRITFNYPPVNLDKIEYILPLGLMSDSHVTPVDHQYYQNFKREASDIEVYSPADGFVTQIQHMNQPVSDSNRDAEVDDYRVVIEHTCTISSIYIHIGTLSPKLSEVTLSPGGYTTVRVPVAAGETIGVYGKNVDYNVVDQDITLEGLLEPEHYAAESWKIHTPDPFNYFNQVVRDKMIEKSLRTAEPVGGKFDHDIEGRLVGNWFEEGTNGYAGTDRERYWAGHLSVAYDYLDPSHVIVSIGTFKDRAEQFGVRGNTPDPSEVTTGSRVVKYELVHYEYYVGGQRWDRQSLVKGLEALNNDDSVLGVALFELLEDRRLKMEVIPDKTASEVNGFTKAAKIFER